MGTKGVPLGYLEFSRAIRGKPCPHMRTPAGAGAERGLGSGSLPGPVLLEPGLIGMGYVEHTCSAIRIRTAQRNGCHSWAVAV